MSVRRNCDPGIHVFLQRFLIGKRNAPSEIRLSVHSRYLPPPGLLVHPPGAVVVELPCELSGDLDADLLQLRDLRVHVCDLIHPAALVEIGLQLQQRLEPLQLPLLKRLVLSAVYLQLLACLFILLSCKAALCNDVSALAS